MRARRISVLGALAVVVLSAAATSRAEDTVSLVARISDRDGDGKHTAPSPEDMKKLYDVLLGDGEAGVKARVGDLVGMLVEPGRGEDYKARYLLHALVVRVTNPGPEGEPTPDRSAVGEALVEALADATTPNVRSYLVGELQFMGERKAIPAVGKLLADAELCDFAARALVDIGSADGADDGPAKELRDALGQVSGRSRLAVMQALGELHDADAVDELTPLLLDASADVRLSAAVALAKIADPRAAGPLTTALEVARGHEKVNMANPCFVLARNLLAADERDEAFEMYGRVWRILSTADDPQMQHAIVAGLAEALASDSTSSLVRKLRTRAPATRAAALHALRQRADPDAFDAVARALEDPDPWVRFIAVSAVGPVGGARSVPLLVKALPGGTPAEAEALSAALIGVEGEGANAKIAEGLAGVNDGPDAAAVRMALLDIIATRRASEGMAAALALAGNESAAVRMAALKALERIADGSCAPRLVELTRKVTEPRELKALEDALVESCRRRGGDREQVEPVAAALGEGSVLARRMLLRVVGRIGARASVDVLLGAMEDAEKDVRDAAVRCLSEFPNDRPAAELLRIARTADDLTHKVLALRGYVRMAEMKRDNKEKVSMMTEALSLSERADEKRHALGRLGNVHTLEALEAVVPYIAQEGLANEAGRAAHNIARRLERKNPADVRRAMEKVIANASDERLLREAKDLLRKVR